MATEIERKFLVEPSRLPALPRPSELWQGYLSHSPTVRVRLSTGPLGTQRGALTIKGPGLLTRAEFEYEIPPADAEALLGLCSSSLRKRRHLLGRWEVDQFLDLPRGPLWLAEIELVAEDEPFERPAWLGEEVTHDPAYSNSRLSRRELGQPG